MQWRSVLIIGVSVAASARLVELQNIVAHGGWLETQDGQSVCLTDTGRRR
jgi:hypothetical protein